MPRPVALITGSASGIGLAAARLFSERGFDLAVIDRNASVLELGPIAVWSAVCDVADYAEVERLGREIAQRLGAVDVLVNNAGVSQPKHIVDLSKREWDATIAVNLSGAFHWSKAVLPGMLERRRGKVINVSSVSAKHGGGPGTVSRACYAASKAGLLGFTRGLAREVAPHVQVNAICPGLIATPMTKQLTESARGELENAITLGRLGTPEEVARMIWVLASPDSDYLTGEVIDVNGGLYID
jgi:NAD(P)-dependent dehydrogenase (short-subunit alcohol dehydrogenase family)